jgi:hypothetical protein
VIAFKFRRPFTGTGLRAALAALFFTLVSVPFAEAQYGGGRAVCVTSRGNCDPGYSPPGSGCACDIPGFGLKRGAVRVQYSRPRPEYYRPRPRYEEDDGYAVAPRRRAYGSVCVTSRGNCSVGRPVALPAGCYCNIPGFGRKRGAVQ